MFIALLKVTLIALFIHTPVEAAGGTTRLDVTVGGVVSWDDPVEKVHTKLLASALPARSLAPVVIVAVYALPVVRADNGVAVATKPTFVTRTGILVDPCCKTKVVLLIVAGSITLLNVAAIFWLSG